MGPLLQMKMLGQGEGWRSWFWPANPGTVTRNGYARKSARVARFGSFQLDTLTEELWRDNHPIRLQSQPFRILVLLISNPNELVTREDIRSALWPTETSLGFDNSINASMNKLRAALEDSAQSPRYIETLARRGYRFMVPVEWMGEPGGEASPTESESWVGRVQRAGNFWKWQVILTSLLLGLLAAILAAKVHFLP